MAKPLYSYIRIPTFFPAFFLIVFLFCSTSLRAQDKNVFSGDPAQFMDELNRYMTNLPKEYEDLFNEFIDAWEKDSLFSEAEQKDIINLSRMLVERKTRPYPHYYRFMSCMLAFKKYNTSPDNYKQWIEGVGLLLDKRKTKTFEIENVLEFTDLLLRQNTFYSSSSVTWKAGNKDYKIVSDKDLSVRFEKVDLICYSKNDSFNLYQTKGNVFPVENLWKGEGGLVTWERGGYSRDSVYAYLSDYEINLTKAEYTAENVTFTNKYYFDKPLQGVLEDKVKYNTTVENATYPKFDSYTKEFIIPNLYDNIDYEGGLSMQGAKLVGTGTREKNAKLRRNRT